MGTLRDCLGTPWGPLGEVRRRLGHALAIPWRPLTSSFGRFGCLLGILCGATWTSKGALMGSQRGSRRPVGGLVRAFWKFRKYLRSNSLQYAKTFKFTVMYCKNRGPGRLKPLKISRKFIKTREKTHKNRKLNNVVSKIDKNGAQ